MMVLRNGIMRLWPFTRKQAIEVPVSDSNTASVPLQDVISADAAWDKRTNRAERRRLERENNITTRVCFRCGFGAVRGVPNSNLVRAKGLDEENAWTHASPVVCAGYVRAITSQARESISEAGSDFVRITRIRIEGWFRYQFHRLKAFLVSDGGAGMNTVGGTSQRIRENTQRVTR